MPTLKSEQAKQPKELTQNVTFYGFAEMAPDLNAKLNATGVDLEALAFIGLNPQNGTAPRPFYDLLSLLRRKELEQCVRLSEGALRGMVIDEVYSFLNERLGSGFLIYCTRGDSHYCSFSPISVEHAMWKILLAIIGKKEYEYTFIGRRGGLKLKAQTKSDFQARDIGGTLFKYSGKPLSENWFNNLRDPYSQWPPKTLKMREKNL